jgi:hypothetical protein
MNIYTYYDKYFEGCEKEVNKVLEYISKNIIVCIVQFVIRK